MQAETNLPKLLDFNHRSHGWAQMDETCRTLSYL
jgi:hypothetical protein